MKKKNLRKESIRSYIDRELEDAEYFVPTLPDSSIVQDIIARYMGISLSDLWENEDLMSMTREFNDTVHRAENRRIENRYNPVFYEIATDIYWGSINWGLNVLVDKFVAWLEFDDIEKDSE